MPRQHLRYSIEYGRRWANSPIWRQIETGTTVSASQYLKQVDITPGIKIVPVARVSFRSYRSHTDSQLIAIRKHIRNHGGVLLKSFSYIGPTKGQDWYDFVTQVATYCKCKNAIPVAETADRWCRNWDFDCRGHASDPLRDADTKSLLPNKHQFAALMEAADEVQLYTLHHPDLAPTEVRSVQTKRGNRKKKRRTKYKTRQKHKLMPRILELLRDGLSQRQIARVLGVNQSQISRWIKSQNNLQDPDCNPATNRI